MCKMCAYNTMVKKLKLILSVQIGAELDALEADMGMEGEAVPSYLQPDLDTELNLPSAPSGNAAAPAGRANQQVM